MSITSSRLLSRSLLATTALAALFAAAGSTLGHAAGRHNAQVMNDGFSPSIIKVHPENGSWSRIEERVLGLPVLIEIQAPPGTGIVGYTVRQKGLPTGIPLEDKNFNDAPEHFSAHRNYVGKTEWMTAAERQAIIAECNKKLQNGGDIHNTYNTFGSVGVKLTATFVQAPGLVDEGNATVPIECVGAKRRPAQAGDMVSQMPDFKVKDISLRFMTSAAYTQQPNPGTRCKLTRVSVRVPTTKAGAVKFKLWTKVGDAPMKSEVIDAWSSFKGPGQFEATFAKSMPVDETESVQAKAEEMINPIGLSTPWKSVTVNCTGAGGGGFASTPGNANPDGPRSPQQLPQVNTGIARPSGALIGRPIPPTHNTAPRREFNAKAELKTAPARPMFGKDRFERSKVRPF